MTLDNKYQEVNQMTTRETLEAYTDALETWLGSTNLPNPVKRVLAEALVEASIPVLQGKLERQHINQVRAKKLLLRAGSITAQEYEAWLEQTPQPSRDGEGI